MIESRLDGKRTMITKRPAPADKSSPSPANDQSLSFVRTLKQQRIAAPPTLQNAGFLGYDCVLVEDTCATVSPGYVRDAVLYLVRLLHGVVSTSDAIYSAIGMPDPAPLTKALERKAP